MEKHNLALTSLETQVLESIIGNLYAEPGFTDIDANDISKDTKIQMSSLRGVLSSLIKKEIISIDEFTSVVGINYKRGSLDTVTFNLIHLNREFWYLHPEWKNESN